VGILPYGMGDTRVLVIEDRGPLGVGGRRIVRIRIMADSVEDRAEFEVAEDDLRRPEEES
jgi:hypothetical protein